MKNFEDPDMPADAYHILLFLGRICISAPALDDSTSPDHTIESAVAKLLDLLGLAQAELGSEKYKILVEMAARLPALFREDFARYFDGTHSVETVFDEEWNNGSLFSFALIGEMTDLLMETVRTSDAGTQEQLRHAYIPESCSEVIEMLDCMMFMSPTFLDTSEPMQGIKIVFAKLYEALRRLRGTLGNERHQKLVDMAARMRGCFESDPEANNGGARAGNAIIVEMRELLIATIRQQRMSVAKGAR